MNARKKYELSYYYTQINPTLTNHRVERFLAEYDTLKEALKRARKAADGNKGVHTVTVRNTQTGELIYQKIEINHTGFRMSMLCDE